MLPLSMGEVRVPAAKAGWFIAGTMMTRPVTSSGRTLRASSNSAIGPSYSSPWLAPVRSAVGPSPFFTTVTGIITEPQAASSRL